MDDIDALLRAHRWTEAERAIRQRMWTAPGQASLIAALAVVCASTDRSGHALALAEQAVALQPDRSRPWGTLGYVRQRRKDLDGATAAYERALAIWADPATAANLAQVHLARHDADGAEAVVRRQLPHTPDDARLLALLATIAGRRGRRRERVGLLWRSFRAEPGARQVEDLMDGLGLIRIGWTIALAAYAIAFVVGAALHASVIGQRWLWQPIAGMLTAGALVLLVGQAHRRRRRLPVDRARISNCCWVLLTFGLSVLSFW